MSELITTSDKRKGYREQLLITVSAVALVGIVYSPTAMATDADADRPTVWIELGGQLERVDSAHTVFAPSFLDGAQSEIVTPTVDAQRPPAYGFGGEGKVTFAPASSDWTFSAAVRYGRSNGARHLNHQSVGQTPSGIEGGTTVNGRVLTTRLYFGDGQTEFHESHAIVDFKAGKDVGLGMFGTGSTSVVSAGVRFAQFTSSADVTLHARPYLHLSHSNKYPTLPGFYNRHLANYTGVLQARRSTHAIGPSLSWDASAQLARLGERSAIGLDWGISGAVLFGRQKARVQHRTTGYHYGFKFFDTANYYYGPHTAHTFQQASHIRSRTVTIPNIGGFAGASLIFSNAKFSLGYRADFFFGAVDAGLDTARKTNVGFYGPYATMSIGL